MFQHLVVPVDGSEVSWWAVPVAARMAAAVDGKLDIITVGDRLTDLTPLRHELERGLEHRGELAVEPSLHVLADDSVARAIARHVETISGAMLVMSSHGHGRSAAVLGSVTDELLRLTFGPIVVLGPHVRSEAGRLDGPIVVAVDGSESSERILPVAEAWAVEFGADPWVVEVIDPSSLAALPHGDDVLESGYAARVAHDMRTVIGRDVDYEVVHGTHPADALLDFADRIGASSIFATTHGRRGMARLRAGSVAADLVRHARVPVILHRPPRLAD